MDWRESILSSPKSIGIGKLRRLRVAGRLAIYDASSAPCPGNAFESATVNTAAHVNMVGAANNGTTTFAAGKHGERVFQGIDSIGNQLHPSLISARFFPPGSAARFGTVPERTPGKLIPEQPGKLIPKELGKTEAGGPRYTVQNWEQDSSASRVTFHFAEQKSLASASLNARQMRSIALAPLDRSASAQELGSGFRLAPSDFRYCSTTRRCG